MGLGVRKGGKDASFSIPNVKCVHRHARVGNYITVQASLLGNKRVFIFISGIHCKISPDVVIDFSQMPF